MNNLENTLCPCASNQPYRLCCQPLHTGKTRASSAQALMRSRFSAFYLASHAQNTEQYAHYLAHTQVAHSQLEQWQDSFKQQIWLGLHIINTEQKGHQGQVEFVAFYQDKSGLHQHHENSYFEFNDQWQYHNGIFLAPYKYPRNQACFCQSGKKFKKCHGQS